MIKQNGWDEAFIKALENNALIDVEKIPKSDLHSHAGRGGKISYIEQLLNVTIEPPQQPFNTLGEMNQWLNDNVKSHFTDCQGYLERIEAAFIQASADNIVVLSLSYSVSEVLQHGSVNCFTNIMNEFHKKHAPDTLFLPDLALGYEHDELRNLDEIFSLNWFKGIDICNYSNMYSINELKKICIKARDSKMIIKAHVGEFGGADEVMRYAEELELDQIQHGIAAADSPQIMKWLAKHKIQLNVCPTSNVMLKNTKDYKSHQIRKLYDHGVPVTINSDDLMIFDATISQEYLNLYNAGTMSANELNCIRQTGISHK